MEIKCDEIDKHIIYQYYFILGHSDSWINQKAAEFRVTSNSPVSELLKLSASCEEFNLEDD